MSLCLQIDAVYESLSLYCESLVLWFLWFLNVVLLFCSIQTLKRMAENAQRAPRGRQLFAFLYFKSRVKALQTKDEPLCHAAFVTKFYLWKSREWEGGPVPYSNLGFSILWCTSSQASILSEMPRPAIACFGIGIHPLMSPLGMRKSVSVDKTGRKCYLICTANSTLIHSNFPSCQMHHMWYELWTSKTADKELSIIICIKCSRFGPSNPTLPHSISSCWRSAIIFRVKDSIISRPRSSGCCWHHLYCLAPRCYVFYSAATQHSKEKQAFIFFWREAQDTHFYSTFVKRTKQRFSYSVFRAPPQLLVRRNLPFKSSGH